MKLAILVLAAALLAPGQVRFEDRAQVSGLDFRLENGASGRFRQVELMPGGVAAIDYDSDGCLDVYFANGASLPSLRKAEPKYSNRLFRNDCTGTFEDVTGDAGVAGEGYSMAVATADYDNDSDTDLFVAGVNRNILYRNEGDGTFVDVTEPAGVGGIDHLLGKLWSVSSGWLDFDNDGHLDLFVTNYVFWDPRTEGSCGTPEHPLYCHPDNYRGQPNQLFRNNGDGTFEDVSRESGIFAHIGKGMGSAFADFDTDGFTDIYVANDSVRGFLFVNAGDGTFNERGLELAVGLREDGAAIAGMGVDFRDYDEDGRPDIFVSGMINDTFLLFRNAGAGLPFDDETMRSQVAVHTRQRTGWGVGIYDFDNDGRKDLFTANSHFPQLGRYLNTPSPQSNALLRNVGEGRFEDVSRVSGLVQDGYHHGAAFGDFDGDGRVDVMVTALNGAARYLRNLSNSDNHWLGIRLEGVVSNRDGLGSKVRVVLASGKIIHNHATTAVGYGSASESTVRFGLGADDAVERIQIDWPSGARQEAQAAEADQIVTISEPS